MSKINSMLSWVEHEKLYNLEAWSWGYEINLMLNSHEHEIFTFREYQKTNKCSVQQAVIYDQDKFHAHVSFKSKKKVLKPWGQGCLENMHSIM